MIVSNAIPPNSNYLFRFTVNSDAGSAIYLDDVRISSLVTGLAEDVAATPFAVVPNPSDGQAIVSLELPKGTQQASVRVLDATGRLVGQAQPVRGAGLHELPLTKLAGRLPAGVYLVELTVDGFRRVQRALVY